MALTRAPPAALRRRGAGAGQQAARPRQFCRLLKSFLKGKRMTPPTVGVRTCTRDSGIDAVAALNGALETRWLTSRDSGRR